MKQILLKTTSNMKAALARLALWLRPLAAALEHCEDASASATARTLYGKFNASLEHFASPQKFAYTPGQVLELDGTSIFLNINAALGALFKQNVGQFGLSFGEILKSFPASSAAAADKPAGADVTSSTAGASTVSSSSNSSSSGSPDVTTATSSTNPSPPPEVAALTTLPAVAIQTEAPPPAERET